MFFEKFFGKKPPKKLNLEEMIKLNPKEQTILKEKYFIINYDSSNWAYRKKDGYYKRRYKL